MNQFNQTFEDYLREVCFKENPAVLDDDMPDFFDGWLGRQDTERILQLAEERVRQLNLTCAFLMKRNIKILEEMVTAARKSIEAATINGTAK